MNEIIHDKDTIYKKKDSMSIGDTININDFTIVYGRVGIQVYLVKTCWKYSVV